MDRVRMTNKKRKYWLGEALQVLDLLILLIIIRRAKNGSCLISFHSISSNSSSSSSSKMNRLSNIEQASLGIKREKRIKHKLIVKI